MDLVIAGGGIGLVGRVTQAVLVAQLFFNAGVDLINRLLLGNFKEASASLSCNLLHNFLAIGMGLLRITPGSAAAHAAAATHAAAHSAHVDAVVPVSIGFLVGEQDGVNQRVGTLRRLDRSGQRHFASGIHTIGEDDNRFTALLLLHQLVRGKEDGVVERG